MVSVVFEHVRRPITVAEVHGGSMRLALRLSVRGSRHLQSERSTSEFACHKKAYNKAFSTGFMGDVGVEHRNARRYGMLVAPAARGTLDPSARCRVWQEDCEIEASAPEVSS